MRLCSFVAPDAPEAARVGVLAHDGARVVDLTAIGVEDVFEALPRVEQLRRLATHLSHTPGAVAYALNAVRLLAPVPYGRTVRATGREAPARGRRLEVLPSAPALAFGDPALIEGPGGTIAPPPTARSPRLVAGIACVLGTGGRDVAEADAWRHVAGVTLVAEWRDGGGADDPTLAPPMVMGPWLVTPDELRAPDGDGPELVLQLRHDGRELARARWMSDDPAVAAMIAQASSRFTLEPGDLFVRPLLSPPDPSDAADAGGDFELELERLGTLTYHVGAATSASPAHSPPR